MKVTVKNVQHGLKTSTNVGYNRITFMENNIFLDTASYLYKGAPDVLKLLKGLEPNDEIDLMWHRPNKACIATSITIIGNKQDEQDLISNNTENKGLIPLEYYTEYEAYVEPEFDELAMQHYMNVKEYRGMNIMVDESIYAEEV